MASFQIYEPRNTWQQDIGERLGLGLHNLAERKMQQWDTQRQQRQTFDSWKKLGVNDDVAHFLSSQPQQVQQEFLKQYDLNQFISPQQSGQQPNYPAYQPAVPEQAMQEQQMMQPQQQEQYDPNQVKSMLQNLVSGGGSLRNFAQSPNDLQGPQGLGALNQLLGGVPQQQPMMQQPMPQPQQPMMQQQPVAQPQQQPIAPAPKFVKRVSPAEQALDLKKQGLELKKEQMEQQKLDKEQEREAKKFIYNKETINKITDNAKSAREDIKDLNRMEELEKTGKLDTPGYVEFLKKSHMDIPALMNPESEEFQKLSQSFMRNAKTSFGGRVSNFEVEQFLKTIPTLSLSPEGRKRVISSLKYLKQMDLEYNNAMKDVIKDNKGVPPYTLQSLIDDKVEKKQDSLYKKFKEDLARPVPKAQNKAVTALQSVLGGAIGTIPSALKGAVKGGLAGAGVGAMGGPVGAGGGAALGALGGLTGLL